MAGPNVGHGGIIASCWAGNGKKYTEQPIQKLLQLLPAIGRLPPPYDIGAGVLVNPNSMGKPRKILLDDANVICLITITGPGIILVTVNSILAEVAQNGN